MTSSSGGCIEVLRKPNRVLITATKTGSEKNATVFARYWAEALRDPAADSDKNETVSAQNARIITRATPPLTKNSKKTIAVFGGSLMLGLFLGLGAALAREWVADVFRTTGSVEQITDKSCVILPRVAAKSAPVEEFVIDAPYSRFTETLRNVKALIDADQRA